MDHSLDSSTHLFSYGLLRGVLVHQEPGDQTTRPAQALPEGFRADAAHLRRIHRTEALDTDEQNRLAIP
ncbi:MAG: hypothetical protein JNN08_21395 [Bryobacterales bacterium]|nr:hypothetical protein [Bryobacterales bacterium]